MVERYGYDIIDTTPEEMMEQMANEMYKGDKEAAGNADRNSETVSETIK